MNVELIYHTPLDLVNSGIRMCWNSESKSDCNGPIDQALNLRIANKLKHSSVLRHSLYVFRITASTKTLLAFTRHHAGVEFSVQSTRYTTSKRADQLEFTETPNPIINGYLDAIMKLVQDAVQSGASNDDIAMLLPQAYNYTWQVSMNAQSIQHFLGLRTSPHAHYDIRAVAYAIYESLPADHVYLFHDCISKD
jgi:thymidylate synthase (FAD)